VTQAVARRALAQFVFTAFIVAAVIGSGIAAARLSPHDAGLELLENSIATGAVLVALILALQPVSAAFNPIVTLVERALEANPSRSSAPSATTSKRASRLWRASCSRQPSQAHPALTDAQANRRGRDSHAHCCTEGSTGAVAALPGVASAAGVGARREGRIGPRDDGL
jgi:hypothetical protein